MSNDFVIEALKVKRISHPEPFWLLSVMAAPMSTPMPKAIEARAKVS